jgi:hypothetical protein
MNPSDDAAEMVREASLAAYDPEDPLGRAEAIFNTFATILTESANLLMPEWAPFTFASGKRSITIHGYEFDEELDILTLFIVLDCHGDYDLTQPWSRKLCPAAEVERKFCDMEEAVNLAGRDALPALDESDPANRLYAYLSQFAKCDPSHVSFSIWTTGELSKDGWKRSTSSSYRTDAWDAQRLAAAADSNDETLEIDFSDYGGGLHLLMDDEDYSEGGARGGAVLIGKIPGQCLADLYFSHRTRLLQRNVRAFLKATNSVNSGILQTARTAPDRFLSYNNGIATTSSKVRLVKEVSGVYRLTHASDFQIVNGGQTTATLMVAKMDKSADISAVEVALKLTIVNPEDLDELVPKISRYANSQNKVQDSDFESNNPWLVKLEKISRSVEATKDSKSEGQRVKWYFERFRGQFNVDLGTQKTPAQKKAFKAINPPRTRFSKTDLAVVTIAWDQEPHVSALGPQKCFGQFAKRLHAARTLHADDVLCEPSEEDFRRLCVILILRREAMALCKEMKDELSPLISNAVRSLYALARISHDTKTKLPWSLVWHDQELPVREKKRLLGSCYGVSDRCPTRASSQWVGQVLARGHGEAVSDG